MILEYWVSVELEPNRIFVWFDRTDSSHLVGLRLLFWTHYSKHIVLWLRGFFNRNVWSEQNWLYICILYNPGVVPEPNRSAKIMNIKSFVCVRVSGKEKETDDKAIATVFWRKFFPNGSVRDLIFLPIILCSENSTEKTFYTGDTRFNVHN